MSFCPNSAWVSINPGLPGITNGTPSLAPMNVSSITRSPTLCGVVPAFSIL